MGSWIRTLVLHWDGTEWSIVPSPNVGIEGNLLTDITALSTNDVWAVGYYDDLGRARTLTMHWNGTQWTIVPSPSPASGPNLLFGVAADPLNNVWAVGSYSPFTGRTLILRYPGSCPTPTVTPIGTPATATQTRTPTPTTPTAPYTPTPISTPISTATTPPTATNTPTTTATVTPTVCTLTFSDVPQDHTFYAFIRCLACRGILGGHADGTFRPGNDITRGQIAKMVSNAAGFQEPISGQSFEDVPTGSPF